MQPVDLAEPTRPGASRFTGAVLALAAAVVFAGLALIFTGAFSAQRIADRAEALHWTNGMLGNAGIARASNGQAIIFAVDERLGVAAAEAVTLAVDEAQRNLGTATAWAEGTPDDVDPATSGVLGEFLESGRRVLGLVATRDVDAAVALHRNGFESAYQDLVVLLTARQEEISVAIGESETFAARVAGLTRFAVTLFIPAVLVTLYRRRIRQQLKLSQVRMQSMIDAERRLSVAKDDFIAGVSHELRTPLTGVFGFSEVLVEGGFEDRETSYELAQLINSEAGELSRMVEDLLTAARLDSDALIFDRESLSPRAEIDSIVTPARRSGQEIEVDLPDVSIWADRSRFRQIMRNLVSNAGKHGGPRTRITGQIDAGRFVCTVADDGPGVAPDMVDHLFDKFVHDGKEALLVGSVGLGLAIARSLAEAMGGELHYVRDGEWTCFSVTLPLDPLAPPTGVAPSAKSAVSP